jgi:hypothetical protein
MITQDTKKTISAILATATLLAVFVATPASADTTNASSTRAAKMAANQATKLTALITKTDTAIEARITSLNTLNTKVQAMKNVSATEKTNITNEVQSSINELTSAKAKLDADTVLATAKTDAASAINSTRIYALVIPQGYIQVSADRIITIGNTMTTLASKLQARITAAQTAGKDVTALQTALADIATQVTTANTQAASAQSTVSGLVPDNGDKTVAASNKIALTSARANIKTATTALKAAQQDVKTINTTLKSLHVKATASSTVSH